MSRFCVVWFPDRVHEVGDRFGEDVWLPDRVHEVGGCLGEDVAMLLTSGTFPGHVEA